MAEEHINATESHYADQCPGTSKCACAKGLDEILKGLKAGTVRIVPAEENTRG